MATYPATPAPARVTISSVAPSQISTAHSLRSFGLSRGGQRWAFRLDYNAMTREMFSELWAFLVGLRGRYITCDFLPPFLKTKRGSIAGSPVVDLPINMLAESEDYTSSHYTNDAGVERVTDYTSPPFPFPSVSHVPDAQCWRQTSSSSWAGIRIYPTSVMADHNILSAFMKWNGAYRSGINLRNWTHSEDGNNAITVWWNGDGTINSTASMDAEGGGWYAVGNGWYRLWVYNDGSDWNGDVIDIIIYPNANSPHTGDVLASEKCFVWGLQLHQTDDKPKPYFGTSGAEVKTPADVYGGGLPILGWTASSSGVVKAGDLIQLEEDTKVYMAAMDVNSDAWGNGLVPLTSPMVDSPDDNDTPDFTDVPFKVALATDLNTVSISTALHFGFSIDLVEANA